MSTTLLLLAFLLMFVALATCEASRAEFERHALDAWKSIQPPHISVALMASSHAKLRAARQLRRFSLTALGISVLLAFVWSLIFHAALFDLVGGAR